MLRNIKGAEEICAICATGQETLTQLQSIFEEAQILPKTVHCDRGTEMKNKHFKDFMEDKNITIIYPNTRYFFQNLFLLN